MKKYLRLLIIAILITTLTGHAQVGIGTTSPNANAALDVTSTSQGMLFPRMTSTQRDAISNPAKGLTIYNTTLNSIQTNTGTSGTPSWKAWNGIHPSTNGTAVVTWTDCSTASAGTLTAGVAVSGVTQTITANVTTAGTYNISITANGVTFSGSGTFTSTGSQTIVITASGTPAVTGSTTFTLNTTPNCNFSRTTIDLSTNGTGVVTWTDSNTASAGTLITGTAVSGVTQTITANVTTAGTYNITTNTANGVTFSGSGTFAGTGSQTIVLNASGTPTIEGSTTFTLNTTPNCSFSRITISPLQANITLSAISPYFLASIYDQDYLPYTAPTAAASLATAQAANGTNETTTLNVQGSLSTTGVTLKIPYTVSSGTVSLQEFSQTINIPASYTEDGIARDVTFSYGAASLAAGSGTINASLKAVGGTLNAKKLDMQTGIGNDYLGWLLAQFTYATNNSGGSATFQFRNIAAIPDRNITDASHRMFYLPVLGADGKTWLNNNLGADYANTTKASFNPAAQASSSSDWNAYGSLFQWGRYSDGHELITWSNSTTGTPVYGSTNTLSNIDNPSHANFITINTGNVDWRSPQNNNLWQGLSGINNPCPIGFRLPTEAELNTELASWSSQNAAGAFASTLKLTNSGNRSNIGSVAGTNNTGYYFTSTPTSQFQYLFFRTQGAFILNNVGRAYAFSVRCIKD